MNIIELKNITRRYDNGGEPLTVLREINLTIAAGEMVAIVGPSGSGKSTLMNIIGCLDRADGGDYLLHGRHIAGLSPDQLAKVRREHIGFIFQRYHLMPDLNALGNVEIPAIYAGVGRRERRRRAQALLARLGLQGREHHRPGELSGGQQQRVSIARCLMNGAEIILADEPTGALDAQAGDAVVNILLELNRQGHTVIIVTHDRRLAARAARVISLHDGAITADSGGGSNISLLPRVAQAEAGEGWRSLFDRSKAAWQMALRAMNAHRLRTLLTMSGITFGIAAVVTVVALGQGARQSTLESIQSLGVNVVTIYSEGEPAANQPRAADLTIQDADVLARQSTVDSLSPQTAVDQTVRHLAKSASATIEGVGRDYFRIQGIRLLEGRWFSDDRTAQQLVVIDENARNALFGRSGDSPIGKTLVVGDMPATVIGVARNSDAVAPNVLTLWLPWSTAMYRLNGNTALRSISLRLREGMASDAAVASITRLLVELHGAKDFQVFNRDKVRKSVERASLTLNLLILMVAAIALLIGSMGVMNIMLVSVSERTHEIGVRMAVGARRGDITRQFMSEALAMCLAGGLSGILLSLAIGPLLAGLDDGGFAAIYSWQAAVAAFCCSTLIGVIFGYLPARKAARMDPVVALASE